MSRRRGRTPPEIGNLHSIMVFNISYRTRKEELFRAFDKYGDIADVYIPRDRSGESRGFGFVRFYEKRDAEDSCRMAGKILDGRRIGVQLAKYGRRHEQPDYETRRSRSRRRYRSGSRSPSREYRRRYSSRSRTRSRSNSRDRFGRARSRTRSHSGSRSRSSRRSKSPRGSKHRHHHRHQHYRSDKNLSSNNLNNKNEIKNEIKSEFKEIKTEMKEIKTEIKQENKNDNNIILSNMNISEKSPIDHIFNLSNNLHQQQLSQLQQLSIQQLPSSSSTIQQQSYSIGNDNNLQSKQLQHLQSTLPLMSPSNLQQIVQQTYLQSQLHGQHLQWVPTSNNTNNNTYTHNKDNIDSIISVNPNNLINSNIDANTNTNTNTTNNVNTNTNILPTNIDTNLNNNNNNNNNTSPNKNMHILSDLDGDLTLPIPNTTQTFNT